MKLKLAILLFISSPLNAEEIIIHDQFVRVPERLGSLKVSHDEDTFYIWQSRERHYVNLFDIDPILRKPSQEKFQEFFKRNYIEVNQCDDGSYIIRAKVRTLGGGPILASLFYWGTKTLCYGTAAAAVGTGLATATPIIVGAATAVAGSTGGAAAGAAIGVASTSVAGTTAAAMATPGAIAVAGAISTSAALSADAVAITASTVATSGGIAGAVAAVEGAALGAASIGMMIPFL
jgi:hypothetical protein